MTLQLDKHADLLASLRRGAEVPTAAAVELVRRCYPEVFKTIFQALGKGQEIVNIEPGDNLITEHDHCVMQRDPLLRRRVFRRDDDGRDHEPRSDRPFDAPDTLDIWKEVDSPRSGIVAIEWDRPRYGQELDKDQRTGRFLVTTFEPLGAASKEVPLRQLTDGARREFVEVFATHSIVPVLNAFFGIRAYLLDSATLLMARPDLHGSDRLQDLVRNPLTATSEHLLEDYPEQQPEVFAFFGRLRDQALVREERRAECSLEAVSKSTSLEILTAIAVPQIHGTLANLLRMQFAFVQPHTVIGASLLHAGAELQPAWDIGLQLRVLAAQLRP